MAKARRLTLLIIPEEGGRTYEFKIRRVLVWLAALGAVAVVFLLVAGFIAHAQARELRHLVARLELQTGILSEDRDKLLELEALLRELESRNNQIRTILSEREPSSEQSSPSSRSSKVEHYVSSVDRLLGGHVRTVPTLWPVRGVVASDGAAPNAAGIVIAAPPGSLVRASAAGTVVRAGFDLLLGHVVVVDHGNRLATEYGHNTTLLVEAGEFVHKGQPLALTGSSGETGRAGLYFSVLENGIPQDPRAYRTWL